MLHDPGEIRRRITAAEGAVAAHGAPPLVDRDALVDFAMKHELDVQILANVIQWEARKCLR